MTLSMTADMLRFALLLSVFYAGYMWALYPLFRFSLPAEYGSLETTFFTLYYVRGLRCAALRCTTLRRTTGRDVARVGEAALRAWLDGAGLRWVVTG